MKILITGYNGFIGSTLWNHLQTNFDVELFGLEKDEFVERRTYDTVIHCGAIARTAECNDIFDSHSYNVQTTLDILNRTKFSKLIYISSCAVYGSHDETITEDSALKIPSVYAAQKLYSEQLVKFFGETRNIPVCGLRLFNVYGIGQSQSGMYPNVIASMLRSVKQNNVIQITGDGTQIRDFVHVDDVVDAIKKVTFGTLQQNSSIYNVCSNIGYDMNYVADVINTTFKTSMKEYTPNRPFDMYKQIGSYQKLYNDFGWTPQKTLDKELQTLVNYEYENI